ncbi:hypothetical protein MSG28_013795 [Choristoneura fumiferana]|uniref:Uncharacterized protein n=1 Tax=Choristoneura fumiferana TaxID=7141 RepID=A0ACC0K8X6_CHOFU|nr:hypothetical protein MSG28_013795 [Choristoneura fumiferana]
MKLLIVLSLIAYGYAAKLDRTYLPPASASSAGGSPGSLTAPGQDSNFGQQAPGFRGNPSQPARGFNQQSGAQSSGPAFGQSPSQAPGLGQPSGSYGQAGSSQSGFGRPSGQPSFGQSGPTQPSSAGQSSGVQPVGLGVQPTGFGQPQFGQSGPRNQGAFGQSQQPERPQAASDRNAEILRYNNENDGETFAYDFETSNGISAEESGVATNGVQAQGGYSYTGDDGQFYKITYTADENGYALTTQMKMILLNNPTKVNSSNSQVPMASDHLASQVSPKDPKARARTSRITQPQGFKQGSSGPAFNSQGQQGFSGQGRPQGQNGGQGNDQSGYDYNRPQNQGRQPNGNANFIPSGPSKSPGQTKANIKPLSTINPKESLVTKVLFPPDLNTTKDPKAPASVPNNPETKATKDSHLLGLKTTRVSLRTVQARTSQVSQARKLLKAKEVNKISRDRGARVMEHKTRMVTNTTDLKARLTLVTKANSALNLRVPLEDLVSLVLKVNPVVVHLERTVQVHPRVHLKALSLDQVQTAQDLRASKVDSLVPKLLSSRYRDSHLRVSSHRGLALNPTTLLPTRPSTNRNRKPSQDRANPQASALKKDTNINNQRPVAQY